LLAWLGRLAARGRWRLVVRQGASEADYLDLLRRARIVFNLSDHGECNRRAFEAAAAGALLFQEAGNAELPHYLQPGVEYVPFTDADLEDRLEHYLTHEEERLALTQAGHARVQGYGFEVFWQEALGRLEAEWATIQERCRRRLETESRPDLPARVWAAVCGEPSGDAPLVADLAEAVGREAGNAHLHHGLGVARFLEAEGGSHPLTQGLARPFAELAWSAAKDLQRALAAGPRHAVAAASLVEVLATDPARADIAVTGARQVVALLDSPAGPDPASLDAPPLAADLLLLLAEWERAAWENADDPEAEAMAKIRLLRWRLHTLMGRMKDSEPEHFQRAAEQRPDLPGTQAALGCALANAGRVAEARTRTSRSWSASAGSSTRRPATWCPPSPGSPVTRLRANRLAWRRGRGCTPAAAWPCCATGRHRCRPKRRWRLCGRGRRRGCTRWPWSTARSAAAWWPAAWNSPCCRASSRPRPACPSARCLPNWQPV
jgi:hypothetical protein